MHTTYTFKPEWEDLSPKPPVDPRMNEVHTSDIIKKLNLIILIVTEKILTFSSVLKIIK